MSDERLRASEGNYLTCYRNLYGSDRTAERVESYRTLSEAIKFIEEKNAAEQWRRDEMDYFVIDDTGKTVSWFYLAYVV